MNLAWKDLYSTVVHRLRTGQRSSTVPPRAVNLDTLYVFLSGKFYPEWTLIIFTRPCLVFHRLGVKWNLNHYKTISVSRRSITIPDRTNTFKSVLESLRSGRTLSLKGKLNQGKTLRCFSKSKVSAHYNLTGDFIRFANDVFSTKPD